MAAETTLLQHGTIGTIRGLRKTPDVDQFLGIQYAQLADGFARGMLVEQYPSQVDATCQG
jgi:hypothetical protein